MQGNGKMSITTEIRVWSLIRQDRREVHALASDLGHLSLHTTGFRNSAASWEHTRTPVRDSKARFLCPQMTGHVLVLPLTQTLAPS